MTKPLYGCNNPDCAEERSYPADMLRVYEGRPYCEGCWDYTALAYAPGVDPDDEDADPLRWRDLEPFVPEHEKRIASLVVEVEMKDKEVRKWKEAWQQADDKQMERFEPGIKYSAGEPIAWMYPNPEGDYVEHAAVASLEAYCEKAEYELDWHSDELRRLEAENQRLREASERVLSALLPGKIIHIGHEHVRYSATYSIAGWNPVLELQALLGGGE